MQHCSPPAQQWACFPIVFCIKVLFFFIAVFFFLLTGVIYVEFVLVRCPSLHVSDAAARF